MCFHGKDDLCTKLGAPHVSLTGHDDTNGNNKRAFRISLAEPYPQELCSKWAQLITNDYKRRTRGPPYPAQHHCHETKWSDLDINVAGRPKNDRPVLSLFDVWHNCPNKLKASSPSPPSHNLPHFPKHPGCETCIRTKTVRKQHRKRQRTI